MRKKYLSIILIVLVMCITGCTRSSSNIKEYLNSGAEIDSYAKDYMPVLEDLPEYEEIKYKYTCKSSFLFESHSVVLVVKYDDETYKSEKDKIEEKYSFLKNNDNNNDYEFSINSFTFKVDEDVWAKYFGMIATSDKKNSIAYLYFYDSDLDYISLDKDGEDMPKFVKEYFKYRF